MKQARTLLVIAILSVGHFVPVLQVSAQPRHKLSGTVVDSTSRNPLAYASLKVFSAVNSTFVTGTTSDDKGKFTMEVGAGDYILQVDFIGFESKRNSTVRITADHDFGLIPLQPAVNELKEVVVQGEKSTLELSLDKKIFNVGKDLANAGGNASDILMNIPSVSVDPEGTVRLRGSDNVRILIDGKPSGLVSFKGGAGLQQLQGSMIERVEIITNPSARYEAEGMAGVINIILKKNTAEGFNGSFEVISGYYPNYGAAANLNYRHKKINFFINYSIAYRRQPGDGNIYQEVYGNDTTYVLRQSSEAEIIGFNNNIRGGLDYFFSEKSILTASYLFRRSDASRITDIRYEDYLFDLSNLQNVVLRRQDEDEIEPNSEYSLIYKRTLGEGHTFTGEVKYLDNWESSDQTFTQKTFNSTGVEDVHQALLQKSLNDEFEKMWLVQGDYIKPLGKEGKFETGVRASFRRMVNDFVVSERNDDGSFTPLPNLDNVFLYNEDISAAYAILGNKQGRISYQAGLRAEYTDVKTTLEETNEVNPRSYMNLFPSAHFTFDLWKGHAFQLSYSRRVRRPFYNDLSPFMTYSDSRNFFSGNPNLDPEFSDVIEVGHLKDFEKGSVSSSLYYRNTQGKIDRIRSVDQDGNAVTLPENLRSENAAGFEFTTEYHPTKWWKLDVNVNLFHAEIDGSNIAEMYRTTTYSWFARQTSRITLPNAFDVQLRGNYEAPQRTAQGKRKSLYYADLSLSKDVMKGRATFNLNVLDVFNSRRFRSVTNGETFFTSADSQFRRRQVNATFSYRINQVKQNKKPATSDE